jgi:hypothetical protein
MRCQVRLPVSFAAGYAWQCAYCSCGMHLGWRFTAARSGLHPATFWGLRRPALQAGGKGQHGRSAGASGYLDINGSSEDGDGGWTSAGDDEEASADSSSPSPST